MLLEDRITLSNPFPGLFFQQPVAEVICWDPRQLSASLHQLDELKRKGYYLVGFISYEAGHALQSLLPLCLNHALAVPLLHFLVFKTVERLSADAVSARLNALVISEAHFSIDQLRLDITFNDYLTAFNAVKHHIQVGDTYQVNLTSRYLFHLSGSPVRLYQCLRDRQKVAYSGILSFSHYQLLSLSPELFFSKTGDKIQVKPMKGTMPRSHNLTLDQKHKEWLRTDLKSIAENIMIVDLLRNDLSIFSKPGSVKTPQLLQVESYETVHQLVSCVESQVKPDLAFEEIIRHLFPCGSITGAPKRRTMEIINAVERQSRGVYTGAIGYILPTNDMCFSVSIRTCMLQNGYGELGVGGGIVYDSEAVSEFEEMQLKAKFFTDLVKG